MMRHIHVCLGMLGSGGREEATYAPGAPLDRVSTMTSAFLVMLPQLSVPGEPKNGTYK